MRQKNATLLGWFRELSKIIYSGMTHACLHCSRTGNQNVDNDNQAMEVLDYLIFSIKYSCLGRAAFFVSHTLCSFERINLNIDLQYCK